MPYLDIVKYFMEYSVIKDRNSWQGEKSNFRMRELLNFNWNVSLNFENDDQIIEAFKPTLPWADIHFQERICGYPLNPAPSHVMWLKDTNKFMENEKFSHTYPERYWYEKMNTKGVRSKTSNIDAIAELLAKDKYTRQAYFPIFLNEDVDMALNSRRVPCTLGYYFYFENDKLNVNYVMRGCDVVRHLNNDLYLTYRLLEYMMEKIEDLCSEVVYLGNMNIFIFNLHCFENDEYYINKKLIQ